MEGMHGDTICKVGLGRVVPKCWAPGSTYVDPNLTKCQIFPWQGRICYDHAFHSEDGILQCRVIISTITKKWAFTLLLITNMDYKTLRLTKDLWQSWFGSGSCQNVVRLQVLHSISKSPGRAELSDNQRIRVSYKAALTLTHVTSILTLVHSSNII